MDDKRRKLWPDAYWGLVAMEENVMSWDETHGKHGGIMINDKIVNFKAAVDDIEIVDIPGGEVSGLAYTPTPAPVIESADKFSTGLKQKRKNFQPFIELVRNQFDHGGNKYATSAEGKEFTDLICEAFPGESGVDWVLGTCMKYMGRYKNFRREKDLLKVATYMYLLWLKGGFHLASDHDEDTKIGGKA